MYINLTKSSSKLIALIYKSYLEKAKTVPKSQAKFFTLEELKELMPDEHQEDIIEYMRELSKAGLLEQLDLAGNSSLTNNAIIYMETKFGRAIDKIIDYIDKLKP